MLYLNQNTDPQLATDILKKIHSIELKKPTMIYTSSHIDKLIDNFKSLLYKYCGIIAASHNIQNNPLIEKQQYHLYITSGNNESNKDIIYAAITSFRRITKNKPHILVCETDNPYLINYLNQLKINNEVDIDLVSINVIGCSIPKIIENAIKPGKTCLIIASYINSIFGSINNIAKIGELAHKYKVPLHVNCNHIFGTNRIDPFENNIDSFVMDFKNIGGIRNFGIIGIKKELLDGYQLDKSSIELKLSQDYTNINPITLEMANNTILNIYSNKKNKNNRIKQIHNQFIKLLNKQYNVVTLIDFFKNNNLEQNTTKKIIILFSTEVTNIISIIPINITDIDKKKLKSYIKFDTIDNSIISHYKVIFKNLFLKINSDINLFDNILTISFNERLSNGDIINFMKILKEVY